MWKRTKENLDKIRKVLRENPEGLWVREIVRKTKVPLGSITYYIWGQFKESGVYGHYLEDEIVIISEDAGMKKIKLKEG